MIEKESGLYLIDYWGVKILLIEACILLNYKFVNVVIC